MTDAESILISSAVDPDTARGACLVKWGPLQVMLSPELVLNTARDLVAAASNAEADIALIGVLTHARLGTHAIADILRSVRAERGMTPGTSALRVEAVAGANTGRAYVHIGRGSMRNSLSPDEARTMALAWTETAVAANTDARLRYVLGEYPQLSPDDVAGIFTGLRRAGGDQTTERHT